MVELLEEPGFTKICTRCQIIKPVSYFSAYKQKTQSKDGLLYRCKQCTSEYQRKWFEENPGYSRNHVSNWIKKNPERWREICRISRSKYRASLRSGYVLDFTQEELEEHLGFPVCAYCGNSANAIDHIVPVFNGGPHMLDNLCWACKGCNASKRDRDLDEWLPKRQVVLEKRWQASL